MSYKKIQKPGFIALATAILTLGPVFAATFSADAVKAAFLFRFASYVQWPDSDAAQGSFVIAVTGGEGVADQLDQLARRMTIRGQPTEIRRIDDADDLAGVHLLYVDAQSLKRTRALRRAALDKPILLVTDTPDGLDAGGVVNFIELNRNVRFEISLLAADRAQLKIDSALLAVAARVERRPQPAAGGGNGT